MAAGPELPATPTCLIDMLVFATIVPVEAPELHVVLVPLIVHETPVLTPPAIIANVLVAAVGLPPGATVS